MKTDDLIAALASDTLPRQTVTQRLWRALPIAIGVSVAGFVVLRGVRPDLTQAIASAAVLKTLLPLIAAILAAGIALALVHPDQRPTGRMLGLGGFGAILALVFVSMSGAAGGETLLSALFVPSLFTCLATIPMLAVPILAATLWALSAGAPLQPTRAGAVAGLAVGGLAAAIYSFYCDQDAVLFYLPAYGLAILLVAGLGALAGRRFLRW